MMAVEQAVEYAAGCAPGGTAYFDALDARLREPGYFEAIEQHIRAHHGYVPHVVVTGRFGDAFAEWRHANNRPRPTVLNGGLRYDPSIYTRRGAPLWRGSKVIFVDDSLYSGRTRQAVEGWLREEGAELLCIHVLYDGSPNRLPGIHALYRYHL